jgi:hypothetical protein
VFALVRSVGYNRVGRFIPVWDAGPSWGRSRNGPGGAPGSRLY